MAAPYVITDTMLIWRKKNGNIKVLVEFKLDRIQGKQKMRTRAPKNTAGFFIVEILIVLVIIGILVVALTPTLRTYTQRAQFVDNISAANAVKAAVEGCLLQNLGAIANCDAGTSGIPADVTTNYGGFVDSVAVANGTITIISTMKFGPAGNASFNYILTPTVNTSGSISWTESASTCKAQGLC